MHEGTTHLHKMVLADALEEVRAVWADKGGVFIMAGRGLPTAT
jgi:hypothetical protein